MKTFSKASDPSEQSRHIECAVCGADWPQPHWQCGDFAFDKCRRCGHVYQNPQPDSKALLDRYDEEYSQYEVENDRNFLDLMLKGLSDVQFFRRLERTGLSASLLDIGCATGALLQYVETKGFSAKGVEVCEPAARYGRDHRGVSIEVGTLDSVDLGSERFSAIHFSHVIEHIPDPRGFLAQVCQRLLPGGLGVVVTPNTGGLQPKLFGPHWRSAIADHVHLFSKRNLIRLLRETGFSAVATKTWGGLGVGTAPPWLKRPTDRLAKRLGFGDVMLVLFSKPMSAN